MKKEKMFNKFMNEVGFYELGEKIWMDVCEDTDIEMLNDVTNEQFNDSNFMINYFIQNDVVDADRFAYYLDWTLEEWLEENELEVDDAEEFLIEMFNADLIKNNIEKIQGDLES